MAVTALLLVACGGDDGSPARSLAGGAGGTLTGGTGTDTGGVGAGLGGEISGGTSAGGTSGGAVTGGFGSGGEVSGGTGSGGDLSGGAGLGGLGGGEPTGGTGGGESGGAGGTGGEDPGLTLVGDIDRGAGRYVFEMAGTYFEVSTTGGRIVAFGPSSAVNLLSPPGVNSEYGFIYGSTLWTSPQADWGWPPPTTLDSGTYTASLEGDTVTMTSSANTPLGSTSLQVTKSFTPDLTDGSILVTYTIANVGASDVSLAPWEVTRFFPGGLTLFPSGSTSAATSLTYSEFAGHIWYDQSLQGGEKLFGDSGDGWIAHVDRRSDAAGDPATDYLVVLQWDDVPLAAQAPGEGEVEIYNGATYIEVEVQGPYGPLASGASTSFTERWTLLPLTTLAPVAGSEAVLEAVQAALR